MKHTLLQQILTSVLLLFITITSHAKEEKLAKSINRFAIDLSHQLIEREQGNLLFSPYNIANALIITYAGAKADTQKQIAHVLHLENMAENDIHAKFAKLNRSIESKSGDEFYQLNSANNLWIQQSELTEDFTKILANYDIEPQLVDFQANFNDIRYEINDWVEEKTVGKVPNMLQSNAIDQNTTLALISALYLQASWATPFDPDRTQLQPFTLNNGQTIDVPTMELTGNFNYLDDDAAQIIELPYVHKSNLSMLIVLPKTKQGTVNEFDALNAHLTKTSITLFLPKFKVESAFELKEYLRMLDMKDAFIAGKADFSGINGNKELVLSSVVHKTFINVDEKGSEAAAATAIIVGKGLKKETTPLTLKIDHPFLFVIKEKNSGVILFWGKVVKPNFDDGRGIRG